MNNGQSLGEAWAIIPARGGSKGVPRKNILPIGGEPLIARSVRSAIEAELVSRVIVSTDDPEIATIVERCGASVLWRPDDISGDTVSSESVLLHALDSLKSQEKRVPNITVFLQCTTPLTSSDDIDAALTLLSEECADVVFSVTRTHVFLWENDKDMRAVAVNHDPDVRLRRQALPEQYVETGGIYVMRTDGFLAARYRFFGKTMMYVVPPERALEVDDELAFVIGDAICRHVKSGVQSAILPRVIDLIVLDFDGVFTDNKVLVSEDGKESVICSREDSLGLARIQRELGIPIIVLSTEANNVVKARCSKLGLEVFSGVGDKRKFLEKYVQKKNLAADNIVYVGNDVNDFECMRFVGCPVAVADAHPDIVSAARIVLDHKGGSGALRALFEMICDSRGSWKKES